MDHSKHMGPGHDHAAMSHGDGGSSSDDMCNMNMLFTWDSTNLCLIFKQWHIRNSFQLFFSLAIVAALAAGYEGLRAATRRYERRAERKLEDLPKKIQTELGKRAKVVKAALYAMQNFYAFMIMLLFMTYNGWVMIAVTAGCFAGYLLFADEGGGSSATKDTACH